MEKQTERQRAIEDVAPLTICDNCGKLKQYHREQSGRLLCYPDTFPKEPMIFQGPSICMGFNPETLLRWLRERRSNCERIASTKIGQDQRGWIEDMAYFDAVIDFIQKRVDDAPRPLDIDGIWRI